MKLNKDSDGVISDFNPMMTKTHFNNSGAEWICSRDEAEDKGPSQNKFVRKTRTNATTTHLFFPI
jgi:hypothetical protein